MENLPLYVAINQKLNKNKTTVYILHGRQHVFAFYVTVIMNIK